MRTSFPKFALANVTLNSNQLGLNRTTDIAGDSPIINIKVNLYKCWPSLHYRTNNPFLKCEGWEVVI